MNDHDRLVHALTQWDIKQSKRDKHHNWRFLGIALQSLSEVESEMPNATIEKIASECLNGRCLDFVLKYLASDMLTGKKK